MPTLKTPSKPAAKSDTFARQVVLPLTILVVAAIVLVVAFVLITARRQDAEARRLSISLAETAMATKRENVARNLKDYAVWQDAFDNLHTKVNTQWASTDGNVGANIFNSLGYETAFVLSPTRETVYAIQEGKPVAFDAMAAMPDIAALLPEAAKGGPAAVGVMRMGSDLVVAGASAILPSNAADAPPPDQRSIMVFVDRLDITLLGQISRNYLLRDLHLTATKPRDGTASIPLVEAGGTPLGFLAWLPDRPGIAVVRSILPPLGGVLIGMLVFAVFVLRDARRSALALQHSADTIKAYAATLEASEARFRDVAEASSDWIWETDDALKLTYVSDRIAAATGLSADDLLGTSLQEFFSSDTTTDGWQQLRHQTAQHENFRDLRCCYVDQQGQRRICRIAGRAILGPDGGFAGFRGTASDVTVEVEAQERANHLALHDPLTGLPNRVLFKDRLAVSLTNAARDAARVAVLCLDLDHFKDVNDTLGHAAGDVLLQQLSRRLQSRIRGLDTVARLGGDEFAIVQVSIDGPAQVESLCRGLLEDMKAPFLVEGSELFVGISIGVAVSPDDGLSQDLLLRHADLALYRAKQAGRSTFRFFESAMDTELQAKKLLEQDLRRALVKNELELHYQPLISLTGDELMGVEALLRWPHPTRGMIPPNDFIPLAEETGMIVAIGDWVLRTACAQATLWPGLMMAVNVSAVQFKHREFVDAVRQTLIDTGLEPGRLELEITEGVLLYDTQAALETLTQLKAIGVRIAMDDFGTGYSSLGYLNSFPFDKIKIDRSFITQVAETDKSSAIVRSVITLGQSLSMVTIAEGVETAEQLDFLRAEGCDQVQGYIFGFPVPPSEFTALLAQRIGEARPYNYGLAEPPALNPVVIDREPAAVEAVPRQAVAVNRPTQPNTAQRDDMRRAIGFARRQGHPLNLVLTLRTRPGSQQDATETAAAMRDRVSDWLSTQRVNGHLVGWYAVWASQPEPDGTLLTEVALHCPAPLTRRLRRHLASWAPPGDRSATLRSASWKPVGRGGALRCSIDTLMSRLLAGSDRDPAPEPRWCCGVSAPLGRPARTRSRRMERMTAGIRDAVEALRAVSLGAQDEPVDEAEAVDIAEAA
ncbi:EAL domain-containing protein [Lichenihabitans sp. Uapishka_5]|uniref:bifunctional diguanylate cyclase/phosphodiesterase n=1 Tax=Lichenihabitans sp. Uapishka_5 TaxID=3037302 RepID=UPI0029E7D077|nr:EAL domain-containing protein [Lichenihabitans sp. Uapishka_5]MDX7953191.1 EAL domain-containing protein [Lichenihabitans sp. Uapishka_5]